MPEPAQRFTFWFVEWPPTHERAGETVEVMPRAAHEDEVARLSRQVEYLEEGSWPWEWEIATRERERWKKAEAENERLRGDVDRAVEVLGQFRADVARLRETHHDMGNQYRLKMEAKGAEVERLRGIEARLEEADVELTMRRGEVTRLRERLMFIAQSYPSGEHYHEASEMHRVANEALDA